MSRLLRGHDADTAVAPKGCLHGMVKGNPGSTMCMTAVHPSVYPLLVFCCCLYLSAGSTMCMAVMHSPACPLLYCTYNNCRFLYLPAFRVGYPTPARLPRRYRRHYPPHFPCTRTVSRSHRKLSTNIHFASVRLSRIHFIRFRYFSALIP